MVLNIDSLLYFVNDIILTFEALNWIRVSKSFFFFFVEYILFTNIFVLNEPSFSLFELIFFLHSKQLFVSFIYYSLVGAILLYIFFNNINIRGTKGNVYTCLHGIQIWFCILFKSHERERMRNIENKVAFEIINTIFIIRFFNDITTSVKLKNY